MKVREFKFDSQVHLDPPGMPTKEYHDGLALAKHAKKHAVGKDNDVHPFNVACDREFNVNTYGTRERADILLVVGHGTQSPKSGQPGAARQTMQYFDLPTTDGGTHNVVDGNICYRGAMDVEITAGVSDVNSWTWHSEGSSLSVWTRLTWFLPFNRRMIQRQAHKMAKALRDNDIPNKFWTTRMLEDHGAAFVRAKKKMGWTWHRCLSNSSLSSSTHQDPMPAGSIVSRYYRRQVTYFFDHPFAEA